MMAAHMTQTSSLESSPRLRPVQTKFDDCDDGASDPGYLSASSSVESLPQVSLTRAQLKHMNKQLERMHPVDILRFSKLFFPNLYQTTAFGLTGLVTLDMLDKLHREMPCAPSVDVIFLDTLYHFQETHDLIDRVKTRYPNTKIHTFKPDPFETAEQLEETYGKLYELSEEMYDYIVKVEPQQRSYESLNVAAVITGRRRSQGGQRDKIPVIEVDEERGVIKINPMVTWSFKDVQGYINEHNVPYNALLDRGYKSVGDWHSTSPVSEGEDERAGRWKGRGKTECGIHNKKSRYAQFLEEAALREEQERLAAALQDVADTRQDNEMGETVSAPVVPDTQPQVSLETAVPVDVQVETQALEDKPIVEVYSEPQPQIATAEAETVTEPENVDATPQTVGVSSSEEIASDNTPVATPLTVLESAPILADASAAPNLVTEEVASPAVVEASPSSLIPAL